MPGKFVVLADLDGAAGVRNPRECFPNFPEYHEFGVPHMLADAVAAGEGLLEGGADEVAVVDGHFLGENLRTPSFSGRLRLSKQTLSEELKGGGVAGVFLTGIHGKTGTPNSFSSHTVAPFLALRLDGDIIGDPLLVAHLAGAQGVPLCGVSGDWVACEELRWALPDLPTAHTKTGFDRCSVRHHDPKAARDGIRSVARQAAKQEGARVLKPRRAFRLELSFADEADAVRAADCAGDLARRMRRVLTFAGPSLEQAPVFLSKSVGALYPGWVDGLGVKAQPREPGGRTKGGFLEAELFDRFYAATAPYWSD